MSAKVVAGDSNGARNEVEEMMSLCLTGAGSARRHVLKISPSATVHELAAQCQRVFGGGGNSETNDDPNISTSQCQLQHGFPPRALDLAKLNHCSLREAGIQNQDRIAVAIVAAKNESPSRDAPSDQGEVSPKKRRKASKQSTSAEGSPEADVTVSAGAAEPRKKRAAAAAAEASFADTIRQQDKILRDEKRPSPARAARKKSSKQQLHQSPSQPAASSTFRASSTVGRRLQDGAQVVPRKRRPATAPAGTGFGGKGNNDDHAGGDLSREEAGALALLRAVDGSGSGSGGGGGAANDRMSRLMRSNWRQAVNSAYEQNQAVARLAAVASGIVHMEVEGVASGTSTAPEGAVPATLVVSYPKGAQGRGSYVDRVDFLPLDVLKSVVAAIHPQNPEALRGANLALLSPRVLWSLVYHARQEREADAGSSATEGKEPTASTVASLSVEASLQMLHPDLDWTFLRRRKEQLSEKARENLRQQREAAAEDPCRSDDDWDAAAAAIESVENAMADLSALHRSQRAAHCSQAAARRVAWTVVTPNETDEDELRECIGSSLPPRAAAQAIQALLRLGIHNWRELANADPSELLARLKIPNLSEEAVQLWIDKAQEESIEEIMVEICGGSVAGVELLREANSGTPRDLAMWEPIVPSLYSALSNAVRENTEADDVLPVPTIEELQQWCGRAQRAMEQLPWIGMFSTPV